MRTRLKPARGFTLIELVAVIIVLAVLSAIAVAKFVDLGRTARIASVTAFAGALRTTAENVHAACMAVSSCRDQVGYTFNYNFAAGQSAQMQYGWLEAGDALHTVQIDAWVLYTGFTPTLTSTSETRFALDDAPTPATCSASYADVGQVGSQLGYDVRIVTTGC